MLAIPNNYRDKPLIYRWVYLDSQQTPLGIVGRYQADDGKKEIVPFFKRGDANKWLAGIDLNPRPLYGLDKLAQQPKDQEVIIVEGEKCAAALHGIGICAVTSLGGAQSAKSADWSPLSGHSTVYLLPDNDEPGLSYAKDVFNQLNELESPPTIKTLQINGLADGGDIVDWFQIRYPNWDGYELLSLYGTGLKELFLTELKQAAFIPDSWKDSGIRTEHGIPNEIVSKIPPVLSLSNELMPESLKPWLTDISYRMQTPPDFAAISAMVIIGSLIGSGCGIRPKQLDDWEVIPNLWGACIGRPSVMLKTPSMKEPMQLLEHLQAEYSDNYNRLKAENEFETLTCNAGKDAIKFQLTKAVKSKNGDEIQKLRSEYLTVTNDKSPIRRILKTNETSVQSMTVLQQQNQRGLLVFRDELMGLLFKWDREEGQEERTYFLEGWNGNGSYTDCKIGRGVTDAKSICISLLGGIQPDKLNRYLYYAMHGNNDGLIQRFQLAVYPDELTNWQLVDLKPNKAARDKVYKIMKILAELDFIAQGAQKDEADERPYFRFCPEAQVIFNQWLTELQLNTINHEENPFLAEHLGKFRSLMPSLALIIHCIDIAEGNKTGEISEKAAIQAVAWCKYLESHARRIYAMAESPEHATAVKLAEKIKAKKLTNPFTVKTVYDKGWHGLKDKEEVEAACQILADENWLLCQRKLITGNRGRPPLPEYHINPNLL